MVIIWLLYGSLPQFLLVSFCGGVYLSFLAARGWWLVRGLALWYDLLNSYGIDGSFSSMKYLLSMVIVHSKLFAG